MGLPGQYPPLGGSEYVLGDKRRLTAIVLNGLGGEVHVKGATFKRDHAPVGQPRRRRGSPAC